MAQIDGQWNGQLFDPRSLIWKIMSEYPSLKRGGGHARGRGRIQRQIRRAFLIADRTVLHTGELLRWSHAHLVLMRAKVRPTHYADLRHACDQLAERVGRSKTGKGRPVLWRLNTEYAANPYRRRRPRDMDAKGRKNANDHRLLQRASGSTIRRYTPRSSSRNHSRPTAVMAIRAHPATISPVVCHVGSSAMYAPA